jgi:hypothetical protein
MSWSTKKGERSKTMLVRMVMAAAMRMGVSMIIAMAVRVAVVMMRAWCSFSFMTAAGLVDMARCCQCGW